MYHQFLKIWSLLRIAAATPAMGSRLESRTVSLLVQHQRNCDPLVAGVKLLGVLPQIRAKRGERLYLKRQMTTSGMGFFLKKLPVVLRASTRYRKILRP